MSALPRLSLWSLTAKKQRRPGPRYGKPGKQHGRSNSPLYARAAFGDDGLAGRNWTKRNAG